MSEKSPVSALQEYCSRNKLPAPYYDTISTGEGFCCSVTLEGMEETGVGRSKRDAKFQAAAALVKRMRLDVDVKVEAEAYAYVTDAIIALRNYCVRYNHPLPVIEIVQQAGTAHCPKFTAVAQVSSVKVYGSSITKKEAKQKAAVDLLKAIMEPNLKTSALAQLSQNDEEPEKETRYNKYNSYREVCDAEYGEYKPVPLADRHNYFTRFHEHLKNAAFKVLASPYDSPKEKAMDVLKALQLTATINEVPSTNDEPNLIIDVDCELDVVFIGPKHKIYDEVIEYFSTMLD